MIDLSKTNSSYVSKSPSLPKRLRKTNEGLKILGKIGNQFRSIVNIVDFSKKLPDTWKVAGKLAGSIPLLIRTPFLVYSVQNNARIISKSKTWKVRPVLNFFSNIGSLMKAVAFALWVIKNAKIVGERASRWIPVYGVRNINVVNGSISVCLNVESLVKSLSLFKPVYETVKRLERSTTDEESAGVLLAALAEIERNGVKPLRKKLMISKRDGLEGKIEELRVLLRQKREDRKEVFEKANTMMKMLRTRAQYMQRVSVAELVTSVLSATGKIVPFVTHFSVIGYCFSAVSTASYLSIRAGKTFFVTKAPLSRAAAQAKRLT